MSAIYNNGEKKNRPGLYMRIAIRDSDDDRTSVIVPVGPGITEQPTATGGSAVRVSEVTLLADSWVEMEGYYAQVVTINGVTPYSQVDLTPSIEQLAVFHNKDLAFVAENENGVVTVYALGDKPTNDYTMQVTLTEVMV